MLQRSFPTHRATPTRHACTEIAPLMTVWVTVGAEAGQLSGGGLGRHQSRAVCPGESGCYRLWECGRSPVLTDLPGSPSPEPTGGGDAESETCEREIVREAALAAKRAH